MAAEERGREGERKERGQVDRKKVERIRKYHFESKHHYPDKFAPGIFFYILNVFLFIFFTLSFLLLPLFLFLFVFSYSLICKVLGFSIGTLNQTLIVLMALLLFPFVSFQKRFSFLFTLSFPFVFFPLTRENVGKWRSMYIR